MSDTEEARAKRALNRALLTAKLNRDSAVARITHIANQAMKVADNPNLLNLVLRSAQDLDDLWNSFINENKAYLDALIELNQVDQFPINLELQTRDRYMVAMSVVDQHNFSRVTETNTSDLKEYGPPRSQSVGYRPNLPNIPLPSFSGDLYEWPSFRDRFQSLVGRCSELSDSEKFYYLLGCLKDDARDAIKSVTATDDNYPLAWAALVERFDKPRHLAMKIIEKMLSAPTHNQESVGVLKDFLTLFSDNIKMLRSLNIPDMGEFLLFALSTRCLPVTTRRQFELTCTNKFPAIQELVDFIKSRVLAFEAAGDPGNARHASSGNDKLKHSDEKGFNFGRSLKTSLVATESKKNPTAKCSFCSGAHNNESCPKFSALPVEERSVLAREKKVCFRCLSPSHWASRCHIRKSCDSCNRRHHSLLHSSEEGSGTDDSTSSQAALVGHTSQPAVLLGTALVHVRDAAGIMHPVRALVDSASQISVMSSSCVDRLGLRRKKWTVPLTGLAGINVPNVDGVVDCFVSPRYTPDDGMQVRTWVLPRVTGFMPSHIVPKNIKESFSHLALADPEFDRPAPVDMLLGADVFARILDGKRVQINASLPTAFGSIFGWIIIGPISTAVCRNWESHLVSLTISLEEVVTKFWQIEEPEPAPVTFTEEGRCESIFITESSRDISGRFSVPLPFRDNPNGECFPGSRQSALRRFESLERKFKLNPVLHQAYTDFMLEYEFLGHMSVASEPGVYFIPHHAIFKSDSNSKIRVVFDASAQSSSGHSLNSRLLTGPKLQQDIVDILLRFRVHRVVFTADICKMYRQILLQPEYRKYQHIFWRKSNLDELKEYTLNTVTYGVNCAPFLALRVLKEIADKDCADFPAVRDALMNQTYVDDICLGADSCSDALQLKSDLISVLKRSGFELKKWASNSDVIFLDIPPEDRAVDLLQFEVEGVSMTKVLGIQWQSSPDVFRYDVQPPSQVFTKRGVLSVIARIFDPLGLLAPVIFYAKHLLQLVWRSSVSWDSPLPPELENLWRMFVAELPALSEIRIPRYLGTSTNSSVSLCGFCDASERGYAAVVYLRYTTHDGPIIVSLLGTKTKMAPMKSSTMPRLELCAAVLLARWLSRVKSTLSHKLNVEKTFAWSDSQIVLSWLMTPHIDFKTFVSNRVHLVQQLLPGCSWSYVRSEENPADCASRGILPAELSTLSLYWSGPGFLLKNDDQWSTQWSVVPFDQLPEVKVQSLATLIKPDEGEWFRRFSSYTNLLRIVARMRRFVGRCRRHKYLHNFLTTTELQEALFIIVRSSQDWSFSDLKSSLASGSKIHRTLAQLRPTIDPQGIIRVGGRIKNSDLPEKQKHPILLSKTSHLSFLLARHWHVATCHAGPRLIISLIMRTFWILSVRVVVRKVRSQCTICVRLAAQHPEPVMADLPGFRVQSCRPFSRVGIDYAGPLSMRENMLRKARHYKIYVAVFVCMTVKAVHLEVVTELSTAAFLAAFDRFVARRGLPNEIYSDCGTNFVGAAKELRTLLANSHTQDSITAHSPCVWHFNPPGAPHFGGIWEAAVRSMKSLLVRTMGNHNPTFEELITILCRIEAVLNSRPLTPMTSTPLDLDYLTPGHFLIGQPLLAVPQSPVSEEKKVVPRWKMLHQCHQAFWRRWSAEYLSSLQSRTKWSVDQPNIKVGDMVIIKDANEPPLKWRLGRVTRVIPGSDGVVRVAHILTQSGEISRPVVKLVLLPTY